MLRKETDAARRTSAGEPKLRRNAWSWTGNRNAKLQTSVFLKDITSLVQGFLVWDFGAWCQHFHSGCWIFRSSGPLALLPTWIGMLRGPEDTGLRPSKGWEPSPGFRVPCRDMWLSGLESQGWCKKAHGFLNLYMMTKDSTPLIIREKSAGRKCWLCNL